MHYRFRETVYHIAVRQVVSASGAMQVKVDGKDLDDAAIPLVDDHTEHWVELNVPAKGK